MRSTASSAGLPTRRCWRWLVTSASGGRVAVRRDGELAGVVARADLLRALEGVEPEDGEPPGTVADELNRLEDLRSLFEAVAALGDRA